MVGWILGVNDKNSQVMSEERATLTHKELQ